MKNFRAFLSISTLLLTALTLGACASSSPGSNRAPASFDEAEQFKEGQILTNTPYFKDGRVRVSEDGRYFQYDELTDRQLTKVYREVAIAGLFNRKLRVGFDDALLKQLDLHVEGEEFQYPLKIKVLSAAKYHCDYSGMYRTIEVQTETAWDPENTKKTTQIGFPWGGCQRFKDFADEHGFPLTLVVPDATGEREIYAEPLSL